MYPGRTLQSSTHKFQVPPPRKAQLHRGTWGVTIAARPMSTSTRQRCSRTRPGFARQFLACFLAVLFVVQPIARALSACSSDSGGENCCCSVSTSVSATGCCSTAISNRDTSSVSFLSPLSRCTCEMQAPAPLSALPRELGLRGAERGGDGCFGRWVERGAFASASTPLVAWVSPPGDAHVTLRDGLHPLGNATAGIRLRRPRGLLDLICVARC